MQGRRISRRRVAGALAAAAVLYFGLGVLLHHVVFPEEEPPEWARPRPGFTFETPTGERIQVIRGGIETGGEFAEVHFDVAPGGHAAQAHIHPHEEERFEVLSGSLTALVGDEEKVVSAGETLVVPPGTPHQPLNRGDVEMCSLARVTPPGRSTTHTPRVLRRRSCESSRSFWHRPHGSSDIGASTLSMRSAFWGLAPDKVLQLVQSSALRSRSSTV